MTTQDDVSEAIQRAVPSLRAEQADQIAETLIEETWEIDTESLEAALDPSVGYITFEGEGGVGGATSAKLENTTLNLWKLGAFAAGGALTILTVGTTPIIVVLAVVSTFLSGRDAVTIKLSDVDASVLWAASLLSPGLPVRHEQLFERTNMERLKHAMGALNDHAFSAAVERLVKVGCFERLGIGTVRLVETVASA